MRVAAVRDGDGGGLESPAVGVRVIEQLRGRGRDLSVLQALMPDLCNLGADLGRRYERLASRNSGDGGLAVGEGQIPEQVMPSVGRVFPDGLLRAARADVLRQQDGFGRCHVAPSRAWARCMARFAWAWRACSRLSGESRP